MKNFFRRRVQTRRQDSVSSSTDANFSITNTLSTTADSIDSVSSATTPLSLKMSKKPRHPRRHERTHSAVTPPLLVHDLIVPETPSDLPPSCLISPTLDCYPTQIISYYYMGTIQDQLSDDPTYDDPVCDRFQIYPHTYYLSSPPPSVVLSSSLQQQQQPLPSPSPPPPVPQKLATPPTSISSLECSPEPMVISPLRRFHISTKAPLKSLYDAFSRSLPATPHSKPLPPTPMPDTPVPPVPAAYSHEGTYSWTLTYSGLNMRASKSDSCLHAALSDMHPELMEKCHSSPSPCKMNEMEKDQNVSNAVKIDNFNDKDENKNKNLIADSIPDCIELYDEAGELDSGYCGSENKQVDDWWEDLEFDDNVVMKFPGCNVLYI